MTSTPAARFGVVGSGWRTQFFLRLARLAPAHLTATGVVTRTAERGAQIEAEWEVPTFRTLPDLAAATKSDFVVASRLRSSTCSYPDTPRGWRCCARASSATSRRSRSAPHTCTTRHR